MTSTGGFGGWCGLKAVLLFLSNGLARILGWWGKVVARHPWPVLVVSSVVCCALMPGWASVNQRFLTATEKLWIPQNSKAIKDRNFLDPFFQDVNARSATIYITSKNGDVIDDKVVTEVFRVHNAITTMNFTYGGARLGYGDVCQQDNYDASHRTSSCDLFGYLDFWDYNQSLFDASMSAGDKRSAILAAVNVAALPDGSEVLFDQYFANAEYRAAADGELPAVQLVQAGATRASFNLNKTLGDDLLKAWADGFEEVMLKIIGEEKNAFSPITIDYYHPFSIDRESTKGGFGNAPLIATSSVVIAMIGLIVLSKWSFVKTRGSLSAFGFLTVVLSVFAGYGFAFYIQVNMSFLNTFALPFILLGIGMDTMYVLVSGLEEVDRDAAEAGLSLGMEERFGRVLAGSGASLAATTFCNVLAFMLGSLSALPAITLFCYYAAICVAFSFLLFMTFFLPCFVLTEKRIAAGFFDIPLCCCRPREDMPPARPLNVDDKMATRTMLETQLLSSVIDTNVVPAPGPRAPSGKMEMRRMASVHERGLMTMLEDDASAADREQRQQEQQRESEGVAAAVTQHINNLVGRTYPKVLLTLAGKATVLAGCAALLGVAIYGAMNLKEGLPLTSLVPRQSYVHGFFETQERVWEYQSGEIAAIYFCDIDIADPAVQSKARTAHELLFRPGSFFNRTQTPSSTWLDAITAFAAGNDAASNTSYTNNGAIRKERFYEVLPKFLAAVPSFKKDVALGADGSVKCSRFSATHRPRRGDGSYPRRALEYSRSRTATINNEIFPEQRAAARMDVVRIYLDAYVFWEQDKGVRDTLWKSLGLDFAGVLLISLVMLVHPIAAIIMVVGVIAANLYLMGMMWAVGLRLNTISSVNLVMAVGLSVDYMMHISHKFMSVVGPDRDTRVAMAMRDMGTPIFLGALTVLLGVLPIAGANSDMIRYFCYLVVGTVIFGVLVGLSLIPVGLSIVGPPPLLRHGHEGEEEEVTREDIKADADVELQKSLSRNDGLAQRYSERQ